ncbi:MAG: RAMP superfamily CRISPR-associated protein [Aigarchaeota archaeon]|nr:RAMP superfamily CRISPR-associated protein [Candidatus Pelearchaeum maunauluense]
MPNYKDFNSDKTQIIRIEGILINETPLRVGAGKESSLEASVDVAVYRVRGNPCIPGSSLKGVLRTRFEQLARSAGLRVHGIFGEEGERITRQEDESNDFCEVCGTFGNTRLASHVIVRYAYPINGGRTFLKTSVGIDRVFEGARPGVLFTEELVEPFTEWSFGMDIINIDVLPEPREDDNRAKLLKSLLDELSSLGVYVGARRSVGHGLIKLRKWSWSKYSYEKGKLVKVDGSEVKIV